MKRHRQARFSTGSWTSLGLVAGTSALLCLGLSAAISSYVDARADGRDLYAGPAPVVAGEDASMFPLLEESWARCEPAATVTLKGSQVHPATSDGLPLVPTMVCAEPNSLTLEALPEEDPRGAREGATEIVEFSRGQTVQEASRRPAVKSRVRKASSRSTSLEKGLSKGSAKSQRSERRSSKRRRRASLQGAVVGVQIGAAVKSTSRPASSANRERPTKVSGPAKNGIGMN